MPKLIILFGITLSLIGHSLIVNGCLSTISPTTTTTKPLCCSPLTLDYFPRVAPVQGSTSYGWDQCTRLTRQAEYCPTTGYFNCYVCLKGSDTDPEPARVSMQFISGTNTLVYENPTTAYNSKVEVTCTAGKWYVNGKGFNKVACSQR
uniref:C6 domain-containing protein n=1 Tax=Rhabditophanes sp. KR3021 TaxID=114890 RepID=A0AC35U4P8_9BILA